MLKEPSSTVHTLYYGMNIIMKRLVHDPLTSFHRVLPLHFFESTATVLIIHSSIGRLGLKLLTQDE